MAVPDCIFSCGTNADSMAWIAERRMLRFTSTCNSLEMESWKNGDAVEVNSAVYSHSGMTNQSLESR